RFQATQVAVGPPVLGEFHTGALKLVRIALQLAFQAFEQGEGIGGCPGEAADDGAACADAPDFAGVTLDDGLAHADLAVPGHGDFAIPPYAQDGCAVPPDRVCGGGDEVLHNAPTWRSNGARARAAFVSMAIGGIPARRRTACWRTDRGTGTRRTNT